MESVPPSDDAQHQVVLVNGQPFPWHSNLTVELLLAERGVPSDGTAVELNQQVVPRSEHASCAISAGDHVEIVRLVGGG